MNMLEKVIFCNQILLDEMPNYKEQAKQFSKSYDDQRRLLRSLMNVRRPMPLSSDFVEIQDELLSEEVQENGVFSLSDLNSVKANKQIYLWQGDITTLAVDAIVNAANSALLGCFVPCHACIDNAIHSVAGLGLRNDCYEIMKAQDHEEETGQAKITKGYNLPCRYVIHTVGPIVQGKLTQRDCDLLASCYRACLELAIAEGLHSIAFCCISTGEFHFPNDRASQIAVNTVRHILTEKQSEMKVIFNVFKDQDYELYRGLLG